VAQKAPTGPGPPHFQGFTITLRCAILGWFPLDGWSARRKDLYLTNNTQKRQKSMLPAGFEPTIPANKRPRTHSLNSVTTSIIEKSNIYI